MAEGLIIIPVIIIGIIIGVIEMFFIHRDEAFRGSHWFSHGLHTFPVLWAALFINMNAEYFLTLVPGIPSILANTIAIQVVVGLIVAIKVYGVSAVVSGARGAGMHESLLHVLVIAGLVVATPYYYPFIEPLIPEFLR